MNVLKIVPWVLVCAALTLSACLYCWFQVLPPLARASEVGDLRAHGLHSNDFKHLYLGAILLRDGLSPYPIENMMEVAQFKGIDSVNPYVYLPFTGQALWPLSHLSLDAAALVWFGLNHLFLLGAIALMAWESGAWLRRLGVLAALLGGAALCFAFWRTLSAGQLNCAMLFLLTLFWKAARRGRVGVAGFALAFAALFKIAPGFLFLVLAATRRWRLLGWSAGWLGVLLVVSAVWCGPRRYLEFVPVLGDMGYGKSTWAEAGAEFYRDPYNQSFNAFFHRAFTENPTTAPWLSLGPGVANGLTWAVSLLMLAGAVTLWFGPWRRRATPDVDSGDDDGFVNGIDDLDLAIGVLLMLLLPSLYWDHYGTIAILPLFLIARQRPGVLGAVLLAIGAVFIAVPQGYFMSHSSREGAGVLLFSMALWGTLSILGVGVWGRFRWRPAPPLPYSAR